jgi:cysteinyl-tRNA synthetase
MDDDFNTAGALAALFQFTHRLNRIIDKEGLSPSGKRSVLEALENINSVLDVMDLGQAESDKDIEALIAQRQQARKDKDWHTADILRNKLKEMSIEVIDSKDGPVWRKIGK